jgi:hypothetical protein
LIEQEIRAREHWAKYLPFEAQSEAEERMFPTRNIEYKQYLPVDPTHSRAWIPPFVRYAKRAQVNFICPITNWKETDWYRGIGGGPFKLVGPLTLDHIQPGAKGGLSTDENIRAISMLANTKKGHKTISDEDLRNSILSSYSLVSMPPDLNEVLAKYAITLYKVGI